jgi:hypothetical protein
MKFLFGCALAVYLTMFAARAQASGPKPFINEFLVDPTQSVELINAGSDTIDISGWFIDDDGGSTYFTIPQATILQANSCAVFTTNFSLNKSSPDTVRLFDNSAPPSATSAAQLIDSHSYKASPGTGISFQRIPDAADIWATSSASLGLFNLTGQSCLPLPSPTPTILPTVTPTPTTTPTADQTTSNTYISEAQVHPAVGSHEWVELYNGNDQAVSLEDWQIDDMEGGGSAPYVFSASIEPHSYAVVDLTSSMFNNDGDNIRLLDPAGNQVDEIVYSSSVTDQTWGRADFSSLNTCAMNPTKNRVNSECIAPEIKITPSPTPRVSTASTSKIRVTPTPGPQSIATPTATIPPPVQKSVPKAITTLPNKNIQGIPTARTSLPDTAVPGSQTDMNPIKGLSLTSMLLSLGSMSSIIFKMLRR